MTPWKTVAVHGLAIAWLLAGEAHAQRRRHHRRDDAAPAEAPALPPAAAPLAPPDIPAPPVAYAQAAPPVAYAPPAPPMAYAQPAPPAYAPLQPPPPQEPAPRRSQPGDDAADEASPRPAPEPPSDHSRVVGRFGVGLLGVTSLPYPGVRDEDGDFVASRAIGSTNTVEAPTFGVRYWLSERVGLDLGVGVAFGSAGGTLFRSGDADIDAPGDSLFALSLHGGLPIVLFHGRHYKFLAIPEVNIGFASGGSDGASATDLNDNNSYSGFMFEVGGRVGAEVHFGFIGIPYLSLQASVGLAARYESRTYESAASSGSTGTRFGLSSGRNFDLDSILLHGLGLILYLP